MLIKYYSDKDLGFATRNRFSSISNRAWFHEEEQKSIKLGDGVSTVIKTSSICTKATYVTIETSEALTRWFVVYYEYLNGRQCKLYLKRDALGEFGFQNVYGKIERGYTETVVRNRKELSLNEVLTKRFSLVSQNNEYDNFRVDNHVKELWGLLYLKRGKAGTGIDVDIPEFNPSEIVSDLPPVDTKFYYKPNPTFKVRVAFTALFRYGDGGYGGEYTYRIIIKWRYNFVDDVWVRDDFTIYETDAKPLFIVQLEKITKPLGYKKEAHDVAYMLGNELLNKYNLTGFSAPDLSGVEFATSDEYANIAKINGRVVGEGDLYYKYSCDDDTKTIFGTSNSSNQYSEGFVNAVRSIISGKELTAGYTPSNVCVNVVTLVVNGELQPVSQDSRVVFKGINVTREVVSAEEAGAIIIKYGANVTEPYYIVACPLFDVELTSTLDSSIKFKVNGTLAFNTFNKVIQSLSGENSVLIDAQVYPYAPPLLSLNTKFELSASPDDVIPFFNISSNSFDTNIIVDSSNVSSYQATNNNPKWLKMNYICDSLCLVAPDQSKKFKFNLYDYIDTSKSVYDIDESISIVIKTALKPFNLISSAVISPQLQSLKNMTYGSDLSGCDSVGNGFEVTISTDKFQEYARQNSNYKQFFELSKDELAVQHQTERVNEVVGGIVNTLSSATMGAIAGGAVGDVFESVNFDKAAGAALGGSLAAATTGSAMAWQHSENEKLRNYENSLIQRKFDLTIGTIKNLPYEISRVASFNEIIFRNFYYVLEFYTCTEDEKIMAENFVNGYSYGVGVYDFFSNYLRDGWFIRGDVITSDLPFNLHLLLVKELNGGIYWKNE